MAPAPRGAGSPGALSCPPLSCPRLTSRPSAASCWSWLAFLPAMAPRHEPGTPPTCACLLSGAGTTGWTCTRSEFSPPRCRRAPNPASGTPARLPTVDGRAPRRWCRKRTAQVSSACVRIRSLTRTEWQDQLRTTCEIRALAHPDRVDASGQGEHCPACDLCAGQVVAWMYAPGHANDQQSWRFWLWSGWGAHVDTRSKRIRVEANSEDGRPARTWRDGIRYGIVAAYDRRSDAPPSVLSRTSVRVIPSAREVPDWPARRQSSVGIIGRPERLH